MGFMSCNHVTELYSHPAILAGLHGAKVRVEESAKVSCYVNMCHEPCDCSM